VLVLRSQVLGLALIPHGLVLGPTPKCLLTTLCIVLYILVLSASV